MVRTVSKNRKKGISQYRFYQKCLLFLNYSLKPIRIVKVLLRLFLKATEKCVTSKTRQFGNHQVSHPVSILLTLDRQKGTREAQHLQTKRKLTKIGHSWFCAEGLKNLKEKPVFSQFLGKFCILKRV